MSKPEDLLLLSKKLFLGDPPYSSFNSLDIVDNLYLLFIIKAGSALRDFPQDLITMGESDRLASVLKRDGVLVSLRIGE